MVDYQIVDTPEGESFSITVDSSMSGQRLDKFLVGLDLEIVKHISRSMYKDLITKGNVLLNDKIVKVSTKVCEKDKIFINLPPPKSIELVPEKVDFDIVHEDSDLIVISKPPDIVVHPACGHNSGTLVHGLLFHCKDLSGINGTLRPGIVHRLDKDTSGLMVVAKNDLAVDSLVSQFKQKKVEKIYTALVCGTPKEEQGTIITNIGRHPVNRKKMAVLSGGGREAITHWQVIEKFRGYSLLQVKIETGRTHQIRVHLSSMGQPVAGDKLYGRSKKEYVDLGISRQCLHASYLSFLSPSSGEKMEFTAPLWPDIEKTVEILRQQMISEDDK